MYLSPFLFCSRHYSYDFFQHCNKCINVIVVNTNFLFLFVKTLLPPVLPYASQIHHLALASTCRPASHQLDSWLNFLQAPSSCSSLFPWVLLPWLPTNLNDSWLDQNQLVLIHSSSSLLIWIRHLHELIDMEMSHIHLALPNQFSFYRSSNILIRWFFISISCVFILLILFKHSFDCILLMSNWPLSSIPPFAFIHQNIPTYH